MFFQQFYLGCLAHASYMFASNGKAVVVDPQRDVEIYLDAAQKNGLVIRHIFETHLHADFVSGHRELAQRTGAKIYVGAAAGAKFDHVSLYDGFELQLGKLCVSVLETPGHTPESICLVLTDSEQGDEPWAVFSGDTLFIGDVGRPDLSPTHTPQQLADMMYDSLHRKLMMLPDKTLVYPAHGAGSLCGRNMRAESSSTVGTERLTNWALQIKNREDFVTQMTSNLPARPEYFAQDAAINREGAPALHELPALVPIAPSALQYQISQGVTALDVRHQDEFAAGHVPNSISIPLGGQFASWAGAVLGLSADPVLIGANDEQISEARLRLARVGIEDIAGYLEGGIAAWKAAGLTLSTVPQATVQELKNQLKKNAIRVLDVRRQGEWNIAHIDGARWHALDLFKRNVPDLDPDARYAVHCKGGYRSMIACSFLQRAGYTNVINVVGGFDAWEKAGLPVTSDMAAAAATTSA
jgi:glyoxylase-like metal-dependent hydrolase (beta-lactamase superfamily II)/rhodanese-related sulfurtransferase